MKITYKTIPVSLLDTDSQAIYETQVNQIVQGREEVILEDDPEWEEYDRTIYFTLNITEELHPGMHLGDGYYLVDFQEDDVTFRTFEYVGQYERETA